MDKDLLQKRIEAVKVKIDKIQKRIQKHIDNQTEAAFIKDQAPWYSPNPKAIKTMDELAQARWDAIDSRYENDPKYHTTFEDTKARIQRDYQSYLYGEREEVRRAQMDLEEQNKLLAKYEAQLGEKNEFAASDKIEVIWQFLLNWKENMTAYIIENAQLLQQLKEKEDEAWESYIEKHNITKYFGQYKRGFRQQYYSNINPLTSNLYSGHGKVDEKKLEQILSEEIEHKYKKFVAQVTDICGDIVDTDNLRVGPSGDINGLVTGTKGNARLWTTLAGGYYGNGNGLQAPHYRLYCHKA